MLGHRLSIITKRPHLSPPCPSKRHWLTQERCSCLSRARVCDQSSSCSSQGHPEPRFLCPTALPFPVRLKPVHQQHIHFLVHKMWEKEWREPRFPLKNAGVEYITSTYNQLARIKWQGHIQLQGSLKNGIFSYIDMDGPFLLLWKKGGGFGGTVSSAPHPSPVFILPLLTYSQWYGFGPQGREAVFLYAQDNPIWYQNLASSQAKGTINFCAVTFKEITSSSTTLQDNTLKKIIIWLICMPREKSLLNGFTISFISINVYEIYAGI